MEQNNSKSYLQIFKSTTIIGGASAIDIILRMIRTKVLAVLVGPSGIGLIGIYWSIMSTASTVAGCGLSVSGVRQIAEAQSTSDRRIIASTRFALIGPSVILAILGALSLFLFRHQISLRTFGNYEHTTEIAILSVGVFVTIVGWAQGAVLNGLRRIGDLARINIISALAGTVVAILVALIFRESGLVYFIAATALITFLTTWYYLGKIKQIGGPFLPGEISAQIRILLRLGLVFMLTGFMSSGTQYLVRVLINQELGLEFIGYFHAAWSISILYVGFILDAMGKDYYPRLTGLAKNHTDMNQLVNQQIEVALLLSGPVILAMLTFTPFVTGLLYAPSFSTANPILRWQIIGTLFKVVSWPMGFAIVAKGRGAIFLLTEFAWHFFYVGGIWWGIKYFGLLSTGISFFTAYFIYVVIVYFTVFNLTGFILGLQNTIMTIILALHLFLVLILSDIAPLSSYIIGFLLTVVFTMYSVRSMHQIVGKPKIVEIVSNLKIKLSHR
ncbi:MAG: O-antigen translocase [Candidatus Hodarchaeota archaeon]